MAHARRRGPPPPRAIVPAARAADNPRPGPAYVIRPTPPYATGRIPPAARPGDPAATDDQRARCRPLDERDDGGGAMAPDMLLAPTIMLTVAIAMLEIATTACYLRAVARGETRPSRTTWLIWAPLAWLTVASSVEAGAGATLVKLVASALGVSAIAALALFRGTTGRTPSDLACLALAGAGVGLWSVLADPVLGLVLFMAADVAGAVPTLRDTWRDPRKEAAAPWLLGLAGSALNLALVDTAAWAAGAGGFGIWGFALYLAALNACILALIARGRLPGGLRPPRGEAEAALPVVA